MDEVSVRFGAVDDGTLESVTEKAAEAIGVIPEAAKQAQTQVSSAFDAMSSSAKSAAEEIQLQTFQMNMGFQQLREALDNLPAGATRAANAIKNVSHSGTNNRAIMESLVLVHEAMSGRFTRLAGSSLILTQALAGEEVIAGAVAAALSPVGLAVIALTAATVGGAVIAIQYAEAQAEITRSVVGLGAASGVSAEQINKLSEAGAQGFKSSVGENRQALEAFTGAGVRNQATLAQLTAATADFAALTGQKAAPAVQQLAEAMSDPAKGAQDLNEKLSFLDASELRQIQTMAELGDKTGAQAKLTQLLKERTDEAAQAAGGLQNWFHTLLTGASDLGNEIGKLVTHLGDLAQSEGRGYGDPLAGARSAQAALQQRTQLKQDSAAGFALADATPEAQAQRQRNQLQGDVNVASKALAADTALYGAHSEAVRRDQQTLAEYTRALQTYISPAQKAHEEALLDIQIANTKNASLKAQLETQKEQIELSGQVMSAADAAQKAQDAGQLKGAKTHTADNSYSVAEAQLNQLIASEKDAYADRAQIAEAYWAKILATTKATGDQLRQMQNAENQARIEVQKQADAALLEDDKYAIAQAKDSPAQLAAAWAKYLSDVERIYHEGSRQFIAAEREKQDAANATLEKLREETVQELDRQATRDSQRSATQYKTADDALVGQEDAVKDQRSDSQISPQQELAQLTALNQQRTALAQQAAAQQSDIEQSKDEQIIAMQGATAAEQAAAIADEVNAYQDGEEKKVLAAQEGANRQTAIAQAAAKAQEQAYQQSIGSIVNTVGSGFLGMARGTETFHQVGLKVAEDLENQFVTSIEKQLTTFLTSEALKKSTAVAGQAAQTAATTAGVTARTAAEQTGAAQTLLASLLTTEKTIVNNAAAAAAAAYQAMAGIPVIGPALGAAAAATTFVAVEAFGNLASAAGGYDIGAENPLIQAHAREMVLPASIAEPLRGMIAANSNGGDGFGAGGSGGASLSDIHRELRRQTATGAGAAATGRSLHSLGKRALGKMAS